MNLVFTFFALQKILFEATVWCRCVSSLPGSTHKDFLAKLYGVEQFYAQWQYISLGILLSPTGESEPVFHNRKQLLLVNSLSFINRSHCKVYLFLCLVLFHAESRVAQRVRMSRCRHSYIYASMHPPQTPIVLKDAHICHSNRSRSCFIDEGGDCFYFVPLGIPSLETLFSEVIHLFIR